MTRRFRVRIIGLISLILCGVLIAVLRTDVLRAVGYAARRLPRSADVVVAAGAGGGRISGLMCRARTQMRAATLSPQSDVVRDSETMVAGVLPRQDAPDFHLGLQDIWAHAFCMATVKPCRCK